MKLPTHITGWAAPEARAALQQVQKPIAPLGDFEVLVEVLSCGVCHSDLHLIDNDWGVSRFPLVPGHEIVGRVAAAGRSVTGLSTDTIVGVGWQRTACGACDDCTSARDNMCDKKTATCVHGWGGYADYHVADARYCFPMPKGCTGPEYAPLLCGGGTIFTPLCEMLASPNLRTGRVGVVAIGGLGHLAVKFAKAMGFEVTAFSSSESKRQEAMNMGADIFVSSRSADDIAAIGRRLDMVLVTAPVDLPWDAYLKTLRTDGTLCFVGVPPSPVKLHIGEILDKRIRVAASTTASRRRIVQMLEFAALHELGADIERFAMDDVNAVLPKVRANEVHYRAVLTRG